MVPISSVDNQMLGRAIVYAVEANYRRYGHYSVEERVVYLRS